MKRQRLNEAMNEISGRYIAEAAGQKKRIRLRWLGAIAAVVAVAIAATTLLQPLTLSAKAVSLAPDCRKLVHPRRDDFEDYDAFKVAFDAYGAAKKQQDQVLADALEDLAPFFLESSRLYLEGSENRVWSPINAYMALAALAELAGGDSRQQILNALSTQDLDTLRERSSTLYQEAYRDGNEAVQLANSLWLQENLTYKADAIESLSYHYYADIYQTDLSSPAASRALAAWLDENTGGLLKNYTQRSSFPPQAVLTLASTVYLQAKWGEEFSPAQNTTGAFYSPNGAKQVTYMNKSSLETDYYWAEDFGAVGLGLKNGCKMWIFLPDEDKTPADVLEGGDYLRMVRHDWEQSKYMKVRLSLPKFDITSGEDVASVFRALGITDVFDPMKSDFTSVTAQIPVVLTGANQAARVQVDEKGVKAASYIEFPGAGAAMPPDEIIDFIVDRPFVFVIAATGGIPLFTGVVNEP